ncbi:MAG: PilZ domain-containing protein [Gallionella sp.]
MQEELRQAKRTTLLTQPKGEFHLYTHGETYAVDCVLNISQEGISVQLKKFVEISKEVEIQYKHKDISLSVNGTVAWSRKKNELAATETNEQSYDIGINLISPHLLISQILTV